MICPYLDPARIFVSVQGGEDNPAYKDWIKYIPQTCRQEKCAAWQDGKCNYKGN